MVRPRARRRLPGRTGFAAVAVLRPTPDRLRRWPRPAAPPIRRAQAPTEPEAWVALSIRRLGSHPIFPFGASDIVVGGHQPRRWEPPRAAPSQMRHHQAESPPHGVRCTLSRRDCWQLDHLPRDSGTSVRALRKEQGTFNGQRPSGGHPGPLPRSCGMSPVHGACDFARLGGRSARGRPCPWCRWIEPSAFQSSRKPQGPGRRMRPGGSQRHQRWLPTTRTRQSPTGLQRH